MTSLIPIVAFAAIVAFGSAHFALRDPPVTSRMKIIFAYVLAVGLLLVCVGWHWIVGEEDLSGVTLLVEPVTAIGIVACLASMTGTVIGAGRRRRRQTSR